MENRACQRNAIYTSHGERPPLSWEGNAEQNVKETRVGENERGKWNKEIVVIKEPVNCSVMLNPKFTNTAHRGEEVLHGEP